MSKPYVRQTEIQKDFGFGYNFAKKIYRRAREIDASELGGEEWLQPGKVRTSTVLEITGLEWEEVYEKKADAKRGQSASGELI